tara:strand:+ start:526 stop:741 length:216 start_codon:yes stop_codon:yes gene_type:complete
VRGIMISNDEAKKLEEENNSVSDRFEVKARLNLNDLLKRRSEERQVDKKTNLIIVSSATAIAAVVVLILNL